MKVLLTRYLWLALLPLLLLCAPLAQAEVTATVDQNPVVRGQAVTLTLRVVDEKGEPDLGVLKSDFRVLGQSTSSQVQYSNGTLNQWKDWVVQLLPLRDGVLTIPAIPVGKAASAPIKLTVTQQATRGPREAWVEFSVTPKTAWQGQQLLVVVQLYYAASVRSGELSKPEVDHAVLEQVGEDVTQKLTLDGVSYNRLTRRYVVFPEQVGDFHIGGPVFNGQAEASRAPSRNFGGLFRNTRHVTAAAKGVTVNVQAALAGADFWLPAEDVTLSSRWGDGDEPPVFRVGQPITRVVTLRAYGLLATQLPNLALEYPGIRSYPEAAEQETSGGTQGVIGVRHFRSALIPQRAGPYTLPVVNVKWWDVARGEWATATLPEATIDVMPAAVSETVATVESTEPCEAVVVPPTVLAGVDNETPLQCTGITPTASVVSYWKAATAVMVVLWLITAVLWFLLWRRGQAVATSVTTVAPSVPAQKERLLKACAGNDAAAAIQALAKLAGAAGLGVSRPAAVAAVVDNDALSVALQALDAAQYGNGHKWQGEALRQALAASGWPQSEPTHKGSVLPDLYPQ